MDKILIVVDMQNDFVTGPLGTAEARAVVAPIVKKVEAAAEEGKRVIFTRDTHFENYLETQEGKNLPVQHCIKGTFGHEIVSELQALGEYEAINKLTFGYSDWDKIIHNPSEIELVGVCTDICTVSNALVLKAIFPETLIKVDSQCCAGVTPEKHLAALEVLRSCQVEVI